LLLEGVNNIIDNMDSHSKTNPKNKGFTLVEVLLTTFIMAIIGVLVVTSYFRSQETLRYLGAVKDTANILRDVRSLALSNKTVEVDGVLEIPDRYGVCVTSGTGDDSVTIFADMGTAKEFDEDEDILLKPPYKVKTLSPKFEYITAAAASPDNCQLLMFYQPTNARFSVVGIPEGNSYTYIEIVEKEGDEKIRSQYVVMFNISGSPELLRELPGTANE